MVDHVARDEVAASEDITVAAAAYEPTRRELASDASVAPSSDRADHQAAPHARHSIDAGDIPVMAPDRATPAPSTSAPKTDEAELHQPVETAAREAAPASQAMAKPVVTAQQQLDLPPVSLTLPPGSDLVLVETTHHVPAAEPETSDAQRPRRVRPPRAVVASEPLEIVETRKDESSAAP